MTSRPTVSAAAAAAVLALALGPSQAAADAPSPGAESDAAPTTGTGRVVLSDGHLDIGPRFDHGTWTVQIRDDTAHPAVWRNTSDVVMRVRDRARIEVPESEEFGFLGDPGDTVWLLPQTQREGVLWPGWNSQEPRVAAAVDREVTWQLTGVEGPGRFVLFLNGSFGTPKVLFDGAKKLPQETGIDVDSHVHGNWAFTAPGSYLLRVRMTARTKDGGHEGDERTLRFSVGPQDPRRAFAAEPHTPTTTPAASPRAADARARGSSAPLWWGVGGAAALASVAAVLVGRRGRAAAGRGGERP
ncbi:TIGR03773 family transporter-associated surface protein [Streptomyces sp. NPDC050560]|uniref:TIGR03773 family transporter-associated surface protein n=1 Tax=Streptomyces sp. NPDC050560 TaxID=3365630 RepID=UPI0037AF20C4